MKKEIWESIHEGLRKAIADENGTGKKANLNIEGFKLYGKTGTAENSHGDDHAWFVGWANYRDKKHSIVILLENAGSGGAVAAPMARKVFNELIMKNKLVSK